MKTTLPILLCVSLLFNSTVQAQVLPYLCNFDTPSSQEGWLLFQLGDIGPSTWGMNGTGFSAPSALFHGYNVGAGADEVVYDWIVSPEMTNTGPFNVELMVRQTGFSNPTSDNCELYIVSGSPDPDDGGATFLGNLSTPGPAGEWSPMLFQVSNLLGTFRIGFRYNTIGAAWCDYGIDNIEITHQSGSATTNVQSGKTNVVVYPNPCVDQIRIIGIESFDNPDIQLFDSKGILVHNCPMTPKDNTILQLPALDAGLYILNIRDRHGRTSREMIVIH